MQRRTGAPRENVSRAEEPEGQAHNEVRHRGFTAVRKVFVRKVPRRMLAAMRNEAKDVWMQESFNHFPYFPHNRRRVTRKPAGGFVLQNFI